jgi:hypothetical protein
MAINMQFWWIYVLCEDENEAFSQWMHFYEMFEEHTELLWSFRMVDSEEWGEDIWSRNENVIDVSECHVSRGC